MENQFILVEAIMDRSYRDYIDQLIYDYDFVGMEIEDSDDIKEYLDHMKDWEITDLEYEKKDRIRIKIYFNQDQEGRKEAERFKKNLLESIEGLEILEEDVDNSNWEEEWKKSYQSFEIGKNIIIKPSWEDLDKRDKMIIEIDPKMAFGTGSHETTSMCMEYIEDEDLEGKKILDIGCGSGILSILASKLGADSIDAVDIDEYALASTKDNARINGVDNIEVFYSDLFSHAEGSYHIIFANILAEILVDMIDQSQDHLEEGGLLVLSGIIREREDLVVQALERNDYSLIDKKYKGDWVLLVAQK